MTLPTSGASGEKPGKYLKNRARAKDKGEEERIHNSLDSAVLKCTHTELISGSGERTLKQGQPWVGGNNRSTRQRYGGVEQRGGRLI